MSNLTNIPIQQIYGDILTTTNNGRGLSTTLHPVQDALGNNSPMQISTQYVNFALDSIQINGVTVTADAVQINDAVVFTSSFIDFQVFTPGNPNTVAFFDPVTIGINTTTPGYTLDIRNTTAATTNKKAAICLQSDADDAQAPAANFGVLYIKDGHLWFRSTVVAPVQIV